MTLSSLFYYTSIVWIVSSFIIHHHNNEKTEIIFISAHRQYAIELFDFDPLTFLIKPIDNDSLTKAFNKLLKRMGRSEKVFSIKHGCEYKKIPVNDILYFESADHKISMHTDSGIELFYDKLDNIILRLDSKLFIQIHKSFIVNSRRIKRFCYDTVVLDNDEVLPISQSKRKSVRTWLLKNYKDVMV